MDILLDEAAIRSAVDRLARELQARFVGRAITALVVLRGAMVFASDLLRRLDLDVRVDALRVSTYRAGATTPGDVRMEWPPSLDLAGRDVLVIDDILDTGRTLSRVLDEVLRRGAASVATCVLLDKPARRAVPIEADFRGFTIPDVWVVGYGLDHDERYRTLPHIAGLTPDPKREG
jgi:hypoxanthine phosphoribosyltransferase